MTSPFLQRQIDRLLGQAEAALDQLDWPEVRARAEAVLRLDPENRDALALIAAAGAGPAPAAAAAAPPAAAGAPPPEAGARAAAVAAPAPAPPPPATAAVPQAFAGGRYIVRKFLGEGGKKQVFLAHDSLLDRDVAFALIKTEGLDQVGRERIIREAQAMGRMGAHPHVVSVFDLGEHEGQPYIVTELMGGGDVEGLIERAPEHRVPLERALEVGIQTCRGLEFAHGKGVVHRDLKPGNVWLTADGVAKLGDFGLAVASGRSRLTQEGMMVGTVAYMPPEQATGGEVTPRSDLYSLGAMLYELATGRPPFQGDSPVAVIGQHVNAPLTPPAQLRPELPPGLNLLITRLLEKDPEQRLGSAGEALAALEAVREGREPAIALPGVPAAAAELFRHPFVGRTAEFNQLRAAYEGVLAGQGALTMVVGEPGIGKTALCDRLIGHVTAQDGRVLVGHCYEGSAAMARYLPFTEALQSYIAAREVEALRAEAGAGAAAIAALAPALGEKLHVEAPPGLLTGDEGRWQVHQAVTGFIRAMTSAQPLLLLLEDLHWADRGSLDLLLQLCRSLAGARLLVVGTYRDVEVDRSHPLSGALGELRRLGSFLRVPLRGLTAPEVQAVLEASWGSGVPAKVAETIHRETEGNPLFVQEVLRHLIERGVDPVDAADDLGERIPLGVPEGVRDIVGKRLVGLSDQATQLLSTGAVLGREFRLDLLQKVSGATEDAIIEALEQAGAHNIIEERGGGAAGISYRFRQAFVHELLYDELSLQRRIRLHQQAGRILEQIYGRRLDEHAAELAGHFQHSPDLNDLRKALDYCETGARRALDAGEFRDAARLYQRAIDVQAALDPDNDGKRCDLWIAVAAAQAGAGEPLRSLRGALETAYGIAQARGDRQRLAQIAVMAVGALGQHGGFAGFGTPPARLWLDRVQASVQPGSRERALAGFGLRHRLVEDARYREADEEIDHGLETARRLGDAIALALLASTRLNGTTPARWETLGPLIGESRALQQGALDYTAAIYLARALADATVATGDAAGIGAALESVAALVASSRTPGITRYRWLTPALRAVLGGRLEEATTLTLAIGQDQFDTPITTAYRALVALRPLIDLGRPAEALALINDERLAGWAAGQRWMALWPAAAAGQTGAAVTSLDLLLAGLSPEDLSHVPARYLMSGLAAATLAGHRSAAAALAEALVPMAAWREGVTGVCTARLLGDAARLLGDPAAALARYELALERAQSIEFRPEVALCRLGLAELLLDRAAEDRPAAIAHLDAAIAEFRAMGMRPALERALSRRDLLKA